MRQLYPRYSEGTARNWEGIGKAITRGISYSDSRRQVRLAVGLYHINRGAMVEGMAGVRVTR